MARLLDWFETAMPDPVVKAGIAHLWFVTIHPFDDGNGRIARAIADLSLARAEGTAQRFYSMSAQIRIERKVYYEMLESTQKATSTSRLGCRGSSAALIVRLTARKPSSPASCARRGFGNRSQASR